MILFKDFLASPLGVFISKYLGLILVGITLIIGSLTYNSYGLSWDDPIQRDTGKVNYDYIFYNDNRLLTWNDRDYGPVFELVLIAGEELLGLKDSHEIFLFRHLTTHLVFLIGAFFCFLLVELLYKNKKLAAMAFLMIVLHPRLYAHSFINTKDIPFLAMFFISFYFLALAFQRKRFVTFLLLGVSVGITINLRIMGVMLLCIVPLFLILDMFIEKRWKWNTLLLISFMSVSLFTLYASWPFLWNAPITNFLVAFENMQNFRWTGTVLFNGEMVKATELPWYYLAGWFSITTPIVFLILGIAGLVLLLIGISKKPIEFLKNTSSRNNLAFAACFVGPLVAVIYFESVVYDGWRQVFFVYAGFVMLMVYTLNKLEHVTWLRRVSYFTLIYLIGVSIYYFPYQNVYFNSFLEFKGKEYIRKHFEMDYWGISSLEALRHILENDSSEIVNIGMSNPTPAINSLLLKPEERARIVMNPKGEIDYFITNYRWYPEGFWEYRGMEYHEIKRGRNTILTVYKLEN